MRREIVLGADDQETLGPGEALEGDAHGLAHRAAPAVAADEIAAAHGLDPVRGLDPGDDAAVILDCVEEYMTEAHVSAERGEAPVKQRRQLELLAMEAEGIGRHVGDQRQIPLDDDALVAAADLPARHPDAHGEELGHDAQRIEQLERRRMERAGAQVARQDGLGLEHDDRDVAQQQARSECEASRAGTDDDHRVMHHACTLAIGAGLFNRKRCRRPASCDEGAHIARQGVVMRTPPMERRGSL